ncbi:hypothetical protein ACQP3J_32785, partial [Escherichia coli]
TLSLGLHSPWLSLRSVLQIKASSMKPRLPDLCHMISTEMALYHRKWAKEHRHFIACFLPLFLY